MFVALSFAGKLPEYVVDCVHQLRLFYDGDIVIILDDMNSPYLSILEGKYSPLPIGRGLGGGLLNMESSIRSIPSLKKGRE